MLMMVSLQNGKLNQSTLLFLFFLVFSVISNSVSYLVECAGPITITSTTRARV